MADRVFIVGCNENSEEACKSTLGPIIKKATAAGGFEVSCEKGYRKETKSLRYYCTRF
jgi:hypothetical protein